MTRAPLSALNANELNIQSQHQNTSAPTLKRTTPFLSSTPKRSSTPPATLLRKRPTVDPYDIEHVSPRVKRARIIKMKLQLAWFKVQTNQTRTPLGSLKLPKKFGPSGVIKMDDIVLAKSKRGSISAPAHVTSFQPMLARVAPKESEFKLPPISNILRQASCTSASPNKTVDDNTIEQQVTPVKVGNGSGRRYSSSPIYSTPSSMGAAKCLLQLAHN